MIYQVTEKYSSRYYYIFIFKIFANLPNHLYTFEPIDGQRALKSEIYPNYHMLWSSYGGGRGEEIELCFSVSHSDASGLWQTSLVDNRL